MILRFSVPGLPIGKARPRFASGHAYTPRRTRAYEDEVTLSALVAMRSHATGRGRLRRTPFPLEGPLSLTVRAYFPRPKSHPRRQWHPAKPDGDNVVKAIADALEVAGAYRDDARIVHFEVWKLCGVMPRVEIELRDMDEAAAAAVVAEEALP